MLPDTSMKIYTGIYHCYPVKKKIKNNALGQNIVCLVKNLPKTSKFYMTAGCNGRDILHVSNYPHYFANETCQYKQMNF